jgi:predicted  nucleic acid-binding Zn-ribbon protein
MNIADHTLELLKTMRGEFSDMRRDIGSINQRLHGIELHQAAFASDIASIRADMAELRVDMDIVKRRIGLIDA